MQAEASLGRQARPAGISRQSVAAVVVLAGAAVMTIVLARTEAVLAPLWLLGMGAGFTLQRSRSCFASAFRDLFLFGSSRTMKGILVGLGIATAGFAIIMSRASPSLRSAPSRRRRTSCPSASRRWWAGSCSGSAWCCRAGACRAPCIEWWRATLGRGSPWQALT